jgi:hypothetical protein
MPIRAWSSKLACAERGGVAIEFALIFPVLLMMAVGLIELGNAHIQASAVTKAVRVAATFAARSPWPLSTAAETTARNLARTGTPDGSGALLVPGWSDAAAALDFTFSSYLVDTTAIPVIEVEAKVPYKAIIPGLLDLLGFSGFTIEARHEQLRIGT